jgi:hypothetical protein
LSIKVRELFIFLRDDSCFEGDNDSLLECFGISPINTWNYSNLTNFSLLTLDIYGNFDLLKVRYGYVFCLINICVLSPPLFEIILSGLLIFPYETILSFLAKPRNSTLKLNIRNDDPAEIVK